MKILMAHNYYRQAGGERQVFDAEVELMRELGHDVRVFTKDNQEIDSESKLILALKTVWNASTVNELRGILGQTKPDVAHVHNTLPLLSPSVYAAFYEAGVPVVQTLHNYRLLCPRATFLREGTPCELCIDKTWKWPSIRYSCYRNDLAATCVVAGMLGVHWRLGTYQRYVDRYIALSEFSRGRFIKGGLPEDRISVKPNFMRNDPGQGAGDGGYALYVGRLSEEKGIDVLLGTWVRSPGLPPIKVVGDGPLSKHVQSCVGDSIEWVGRQPSDVVLAMMKQAAFLVLPSLCYENFPMTVVEAYACGTPVLASRIGSMAEIVHDGITGLHFDPGSSEDLAENARWLWTHPLERAVMRQAARREFEQKYTAEVNYRQLMSIYERVVEEHRVQRKA